MAFCSTASGLIGALVAVFFSADVVSAVTCEDDTGDNADVEDAMKVLLEFLVEGSAIH